jgi:Holliday junction resolvase-like predicted endonuclease
VEKRTLTGICGGTGTFIAKNYEPARQKGELDLVRFGGAPLTFVEVRARAVAKGKIALPELSIGREKHQVLVRTAHAFLRERHVKKCPVRFDVVGINNTPGKPPVVRLHQGCP